MRTIILSLIAILLWGPAATAQIDINRGRVGGGGGASSLPPQPDPLLVTKTITLRQLSATQARTLLAPYLKSTQGSLNTALDNVITIKDRADGIAEMEKVLAEYDRPAAVITLNFDLIQADSGQRASGDVVPTLDASLTSVLRYTRYRLLGTALGSVSAGQTFTQTIAASDQGGKYDLETFVGNVRSTSGIGTASLRVTLRRTGPLAQPTPGGRGGYGEIVLQTGLDVPLGQSVVLGTSAVTGLPGALVLVVRPQLLAAPRR